MSGRVINYNAVICEGFYILDLGAVDTDDDQPGTLAEVCDVL